MPRLDPALSNQPDCRPFSPVPTSDDTHVDTDDRTDHLRDDDHVSQVGLDHGGLLVGSSLLLGLSELLDQSHWSSLKTSLEPPSGTSVDELLCVKSREQGREESA